MSYDEHHDVSGQREDLLTAGLRVLLAERNQDPDAIPQDDEYEARDAFALTARTYVRAIDMLPDGHRPPGWDLDEIEALRVQVARLTEERNWRRAAIDRNDRVIGVFVDYHANVHPLPEDVRKKVVAAMDGVDVAEVRD